MNDVLDNIDQVLREYIVDGIMEEFDRKYMDWKVRGVIPSCGVIRPMFQINDSHLYPCGICTPYPRSYHEVQNRTISEMLDMTHYRVNYYNTGSDE